MNTKSGLAPDPDPTTPIPAPTASGDADLDAFVRADVQEGKRVRQLQPHRLVLTIGVVLALGWLFSDTVDELRFHFSDAPIEDLGRVEELDPSRVLPTEAYVRVVGVVGNKAATVSGLRPGSFRRGPIQVRQLLGSSVFIEFDQNLHHARLSLYSRKTFEGRLVDFGPQSELSSVRDYFRRRFAMDVGDDARLLIIDEAPGEMWRYPLYFGLGLLLALSSLMFFLWSLRTRVVDEDAILK